MTAQLQAALDLGGQPTAGEVLERIRRESRDEAEKGRWFEQLFMRLALQEPEFEIDAIWRWPDWPDREELTGLDGRDMGIDLVARRTSGEWVAIQCKCYDSHRRLGKGEIDKFLGGSQHPIFQLRWIVATCPWGPIAERAIENAQPQVRQIDFRQFGGVQVEERDARRPVQEPWPRGRRTPSRTRCTVSATMIAAGSSWPAGRARPSYRCGSPNERWRTAGGSCSRRPPSRWSRRRGASGSGTPRGRCAAPSSAPTVPLAGAARTRTSACPNWNAPSPRTRRGSRLCSKAKGRPAWCSARTNR